MKHPSYVRVALLFAMITASLGPWTGVQSATEPAPRVFVTLDIADALFTRPADINPSGDIVGTYADANYVLHGFLRDREGNLTLFDPPGSSRTIPADINAAGEITGTAILGGPSQGFIREPDGSFVTFGVQGAVVNGATAINQDGVVTGAYYGVCGGHTCGFVRTRDGEVTPFSVLEPRTDTVPGGITPSGPIVGSYVGEAGHAVFLRTPNGDFDTFDFPEGTTPLYVEVTGVNPAGEISGYYVQADGSQLYHGFLLEPGR